MSKGRYIQSIVFKKPAWTQEKAERWLRENGHVTTFFGKGADETEHSFRFRQMAPLTQSEKKKGFYYTSQKLEGRRNKGITFIYMHSPWRTM